MSFTAKEPRCQRLIEQTSRYRALSLRLVEKELAEVCQHQNVEVSLCVGDFDFLVVIENEPRSMISMAEAAKALGINPSSATRRVRRLLECGLITKTVDQADDRRYWIALTEAGIRLMKELDDCLLAATREMYAMVTDEEMEMVFSFMDKCIEGLQRVLKENG